MAQIQRTRDLGLKLALSFTLAWSPVFAQAQAAAPASTPAVPGTQDRLAKLTADLSEYLDRALFPDVPRLVPAGAPTTNEISQAEKRLATLRLDLQANLEQLRAVSVDQETENLAELSDYFSAVQNVEGLKILSGQEVHPENWDAEYGLQVPAETLSQLELVISAAVASETRADLSQVAALDAEFAKLKLDQVSFQTRLAPVQGRWMMDFMVNPSFAEKFEQTGYVFNPSPKNVLLYALQWSASKLYESQALAWVLEGRALDKIPEPTATARARFASLKVKRQQLLDQDLRLLYAKQKPAFLKAVFEAMDKVEDSGRGLIVDENFVKAFKTAMGLPIDEDKIREQIPNIQRDEKRALRAILPALVNMSELHDWAGQARFLIREAKILSLRWLYLANPDTHLAEQPAAARVISQMIDQRAAEIAEQAMSNTVLVKQLGEAESATNLFHLRQEQRADFQKTVKEAARKLHDFETTAINIQYLVGAHRDDFTSMQMTPFASNLVDVLAAQPSYRAAYTEYRNEFFAFLEGFELASPAKDLHKLKDAFAAATGAKWSPTALAGRVNSQFVAALNVQAATQEKSLSDLIKIGKTLKFDAYEDVIAGNANPADNAANPNSLKLKDSKLSFLWNTEKQAYQNEMKKDLLNSSPLLGGQMPRAFSWILPSKMLWERLNDATLSEEQKNKAIDDQLAVVEKQILTDNALLENESKNLEASGDALANAGSTLRILVTQSSQLAVGLGAFAGFSTYYDDIKNQLMMPGLIGRQWEQFSSWTNSATNYVMILWALSLAAGPFAKAGKAVDVGSQFFARVFGAGWAKLNTFFLGFIGFTIVDDAILGYGTEASRTETLRKFFACGSAAPCVTLYRDVALQDDLADSYRGRFRMNVLTIGLVLLGVRYIPAVYTRLLETWKNIRLERLTKVLEPLGLSEKSNLSEESVRKAAIDAMAKARAIADPLKREVAENYVRAAQARFELEAWKETSKWFQQNERFANAADRLGLTAMKQDWKDMANLDSARLRLEQRYRAGEIGTTEYDELSQALLNMYQVLRPVYAQMGRNPFMMNFMDRVWNASNAASQTQISTTQAYYQSLNLGEFHQRMQELMGQDLSRPKLQNGELTSENLPVATSGIDKLVERLTAVLNKDPQNKSRIEALLNAFRRGKETKP